MLCPPIDGFKEPESLFHTEKIAGKVPLDNKYIKKFNYAHFISIVVPDALTIPDKLTSDILAEDDYYKVLNLDVSSLMNKTFLDLFINNGKFTLLSIKSRIDCDNCVAITPNGNLILHLDKDTYYSLGIDGKISHFLYKIKSHFVVTVNLKDVKLQSNSSKLNKLKCKLQILEKFDVILTWKPNEEDICPSSVAKYFYDLDNDITACHIDFKSHTTYSVKVPVIDLNQVENEDVVDFLEWLGMVSLEGNLATDSPSDYVNTYVTPTPNVELGQVKCLQWRGLFTPDQTEKLIKEYMLYNEQVDKPWISIYIQGFSDAPITWDGEEQNFFTSGDNSYAILFNKNCSIFCVHKTSRKQYK